MGSLLSVEEQANDLLIVIENIKCKRQEKFKAEEQLGLINKCLQELEGQLNSSLKNTNDKVASYLNVRSNAKKIVLVEEAKGIIEHFLSEHVGHKFTAMEISSSCNITPTMTRRVLREESSNESSFIAKEGNTHRTKYLWKVNENE